MKPSTGKKLAVSIIFGYILSVILLTYLIRSEASNVRTTISEIQRLQGSIKNSGGVPGGFYRPQSTSSIKNKVCFCPSTESEFGGENRGIPTGSDGSMGNTIPTSTLRISTVKPYEIHSSKKIKCIEVSGVKYLAEDQGDGVYKIMDVPYQDQVKICGQGRRQT